MKKIFLAVIVAALLAGCGAAADSGSTAAETEAAAETVTEAEMTTEAVTAAETEAADTETAAAEEVNTGSGTTLIAWFSRVGNSDFDDAVDAVTGASTNIDNGVLRGNNSYLEEIVERETGADEYFIQVDELYPGSFGDTVRQFVDEERDDVFHGLGTRVENMDQYDTVILIYPTWDSTLPSPVRTFLKSYDFTGKRICPVNSNDGYGLGDSVRRIQTYAPGAEVMDAFSIYDEEFADLDTELTQYLEEQGLTG